MRVVESGCLASCAAIVRVQQTPLSWSKVWIEYKKVASYGEKGCFEHTKSQGSRGGTDKRESTD